MARLQAALIVDSDPQGLEALVYGFEGEGCRTTATTDYAGVGTMLTAAAPQLVVVMVREPAAPATALVQALREREGASLPVLALGPMTLRHELRAISGVEF